MGPSAISKFLSRSLNVRIKAFKRLSISQGSDSIGFLHSSRVSNRVESEKLNRVESAIELSQENTIESSQESSRVGKIQSSQVKSSRVGKKCRVKDKILQR